MQRQIKTQTLAILAGMSVGTIISIENGGIPPATLTRRQVRALALALNVDPDGLWSHAQTSIPSPS